MLLNYEILFQIAVVQNSENSVKMWYIGDSNIRYSDVFIYQYRPSIECIECVTLGDTLILI